MDADVDPSTIVQIIPGTGWVLEYLNEDGQLDVSPLLAWGLQGGGNVVPLDVDECGFVDEPDLKINRLRPQIAGDAARIEQTVRHWKLTKAGDDG